MLAITIIFCVLILCSSVLHSVGRDTISSANIPLTDGETLVSSGKRFELGFFTPDGSSDNRRYVEIWYYKMNPRTVVWVANRDSPLTETGGVFAVDYGDLKVLDKSGKLYWHTNLEGPSNPKFFLEAKLMDSGNLVLRNQWKVNIWQSFKQPTDTFISGMKMDDELMLTSWTGQIDPKPGNFTLKLDQKDGNQLIINRNIYINHWRSGVSGEFFHSDTLPYAVQKLLFNSSNATSIYNSKRVVINFNGEIQYWSLDMDENKWSKIWWNPMDRCSELDACGSFSSCNSNDKLACKCLPGFRPKVQAHWDNRVFSSGCTRNSTCNENDIFLKLKKMKVYNTDLRIDDKNETECREACLQNCQCVAYSYTQNENSERTAPSTCWIWTEELKNLQEDYDGGHDISVRLARSDLESTVRTCKACGTNIIPYPLSTGSNCGDPAYFNFHCSNYSTGKLSFNIPETGSYNVTSINPTARRFVIQAKETNNCDARSGEILQLNRSLSLHFKLIHVTCSHDTDAGSLSSDIKFQGIDEIEISWNPPKEPSCISSSDCKDWPYSTCNVTRDGPKRCLCNANFRWDGSALNCTPVEAGSNHKQFEEGSPRKSAPLLLILGVTIACIIFFSCVTAVIFICKRSMVKRKERKENIERNATVLYGTEKRVKGLIYSEDFKEEDKKRIDVPFFDLDSIIAATDNFSAANKLGRGGFGPVYKGTFPEGQEIAIKRLSSVSGQGLEEFKNEVVLIARLQHRNLVRLLGYCIHGNEKILLYEYMPNKSLDGFIFDPKLSLLLNWDLRFNIILGVARGLLYLHQDSRLRIIHRDLKTSNILLDAEMNPKISDFGLARIFEGKQTEGSTQRVMGTYGYMSPEYALDGLFSVKSDAFSFGVVVLEIISGRRSTGAFKLEKDLNLLSTAWRLWRADKALDFLDETISQSVNRNEFIKCLHVALLCVQEDPADRPNMSNVVVMLSSEVATFPIPRQPAFVERKGLSDTASSSIKQEINMSWSVESGGSR